jgi:tRNA(fMet)-specific endonuclease VapC
MSSILIDTNVLSYMIRDTPLGKRYVQQMIGLQPAISFQSLAEMRFGSKKDNWSTARIQQLEAFLHQFAVLYPTDTTVSLWANIRTEVFGRGHHIDAADAWIAAIALELNAPLLTHNVKDFEHVPGLKVITIPTIS